MHQIFQGQESSPNINKHEAEMLRTSSSGRPPKHRGLKHQISLQVLELGMKSRRARELGKDMIGDVLS